MTNPIQLLLRDKPPVMVLDMGLGSREQGFSVETPKRIPTIAMVPARPPTRRSPDPGRQAKGARREAGLFLRPKVTPTA